MSESTTKLTLRSEDEDSGLVVMRVYDDGAMRVYDDGAMSLSRGPDREDFVYLSPAAISVLKAAIAESEKLSCTTQSD